MTNYWPGLISMLTTLWVAVSSRLGLVLPRAEESRFMRLLRGSDRPGSSPIRYRSASLAAVCTAAQASTVVLVFDATRRQVASAPRTDERA